MRILIAEHESGARRELRTMLQELGHTVTVAADGREALNLVRQRTYGLTILGSELPFGDVVQIAHKLTRERQLPILLLVDNATAETVVDLSALPFYGCVFRPVHLPALHLAITVAAERFSEKQALSSRVNELEVALDTRKLIDRAKGKLMRMGMSEQKAFLSIQARARRTQKSMRSVARAILGD